MAQDQKDNAGFALPSPETNSTTTLTTTQGNAVTRVEVGVNPALTTDTSSRDLMIGGAILLVLLVAFFFAKNAYANGLVSKRVPPNKANAAGWWLWVFLASLATGVVLSAVNSSKFMAPLILGPIALVALIGLVLAILSSRK
jgi:hypothetical protein